MAITRTKYSIAHTSWNDLAAGSWAGSAIHDLRTSGCHDAVIAGRVASDSASGPTAGDTIDLYLVPFMADVAGSEDYEQGGMTDDTPTPYDSDEALTEGSGASGQIKLENLILAASLTLETELDTRYDFVFGVVATLGYMPDKVGVVVYNGITTNTMGASGTHKLEVTELTYA